MNVRGPGDRLTSVGVNATLSLEPPAGFCERSQIVSVTREELKRDNAARTFSIAVADRGEWALTYRIS